MPTETLPPLPETADDQPPTPDGQADAKDMIDRAYQAPPPVPWERGQTAAEIGRSHEREAETIDRANDWQQGRRPNQVADLDPTIHRTGSEDQPLAPYERGLPLDSSHDSTQGKPTASPEVADPGPPNLAEKNGLSRQVTDPWNPQFNRPEVPRYPTGQNIPLEVTGPTLEAPILTQPPAPEQPASEPEIIRQPTAEELPNQSTPPTAPEPYSYGNRIPLDVPGVEPAQPEPGPEDQGDQAATPKSQDLKAADQSPPPKKGLLARWLDRLFPPDVN